MKRRIFILTAATLGLGALIATTALAHGSGYGPGQGQGPGQGYMHGQGNMHGQGYMHGGQGGPGMMQGHGYGPGAGDCQTNQTLDTPLTIEDVRAQLEQHLQARGNDRLKVGNVTDKDDATIIAEIVTVDDSLVRQIEIDKATGRRTPVR